MAGALFTLSEAAQFLRFEVSYLRKLVQRHQITHYRPNNGRILFRQEDLEMFISRGRVASAQELHDQADSHTSLMGGLR